MPSLFARLRRLDLISVILGLGVLLRLRQYLANRSFWFDEAHIALTILDPLFGLKLVYGDYHQTMPVGFALLANGVTDLFGTSELAFRAIPFAAGIASLFLFRSLMCRVVEGSAAKLAFFLFAVSPTLVYFSSEFKPYSSDLFFSLAITLAALEMFDSAKLKAWLGFALLGALAVWSSFPSVFVLAGAGLVLCVTALKGRAWARFGCVAACSWIWAMSFVVHYALFIDPISTKPKLIRAWEGTGTFLRTPEDLWNWLSQHSAEMLQNSLGLGVLVAVCLLPLGAYRLLKRHPRPFWMLITPLAFTFVAAAAKKYPLMERLLLFAVPAILIVLVEGTRPWHGWLSKHSRSVPFALLLVILVPLSGRAAWRFVEPQKREDLRPLLEDIIALDDEVNPDALYVYYGAKRAFDYYKSRMFFSMPIIRGADSRRKPERYGEEFKQSFVNVRRAWVVFSHIHRPRLKETRALAENDDETSEKNQLLKVLDSMGTRMKTLHSEGAWAYLYRF